MNKMKIYFLAGCLLSIFLGDLFAQAPGVNKDFDFSNENTAKSMVADNFLIPAYGLIINSYDIHNMDNNLLALSARPWMQFNMGQSANLYVRGRENYSTFLKKDEYVEKSSENLIDLDLGYYEFEKYRFALRIGRQFVSIGHGLLLDSRADGVTAGVNFSFFHASLLGIYSGWLQADYNPFNLSDKDFSDSAKRLFTGGLFGFRALDQKIDFIFLKETDFAKKENSIEYTYNVSYVGLAAMGEIAANVHYLLEWYYQFGEGHMDGTSAKKDIASYGGLVKVYYFFKHIMMPQLFVTYARGNGDPDRESALSPIGNQAGKDEGFIHFGTFQEGLGLRPVLSNLQVANAGFSIKPFNWAKNRMLRDIQVMGKYLQYWKTNPRGGINYGEALDTGYDIGWGCDLSVGWRLSAEFSLVMAYGFFKPGAAFEPNEDNRHMILTGFNLSL